MSSLFCGVDVASSWRVVEPCHLLFNFYISTQALINTRRKIFAIDLWS
jgi:hypothetical protein